MVEFNSIDHWLLLAGWLAEKFPYKLCFEDNFSGSLLFVGAKLEDVAELINSLTIEQSLAPSG